MSSTLRMAKREFDMATRYYIDNWNWDDKPNTMNIKPIPDWRHTFNTPEFR